jgi:hypothetical protein
VQEDPIQRPEEADAAAAQPLIERTLAIRERALGTDHPDTAEALNNLGAIHRMLGDNDAARCPYERALAIRERALGPDDLQAGRVVSVAKGGLS